MDETARAWLTRFTRRPLPRVPRVETFDTHVLNEAALAAARFVWARRVVNETGSIVVARRLRGLAERLPNHPPELLHALERLEEDEERHAALAREMLARLGGSVPASLPTPAEPEGTLEERYARLVLSGLAIGETVSAARYAAVRRHTDLELPRACIELLLRDEVGHSELGFVLLPFALNGLVPESRAALLEPELRGAFRYLDEVVGLDAERRGLTLEERPQPEGNPGVVEPLIDAVAFYTCLRQTLVPRLTALGLDAEGAWRERHQGLSSQGPASHGPSSHGPSSHASSS